MGGYPNPGGLFDQQQNHVKWMEAVIRARNTVEAEKIKNPEKNVAQERLKERAQLIGN